ncbi:hypothetical protein [Herbaspirillum robiniae]|uniref:DUF3828 domain-containing protein n=1 Tax=Herbaspirillum robiniae TaxID=2014887 RepID=A0ABX2LY89_9BURK|nr:hypothetical protein [Herbaspirillum robiniae]NUU03454.1 hypothetical protein [Herbaspirillum robiniae]
MMKWIAALAATMALLQPGAGEAACTRPDPALLRGVWQDFRAATLEGRPEQAARFYRFPLKLLSPYDGDKPRLLPRAVFIAHYEELFRQQMDSDAQDLLSQMKKGGGREYIGEPPFNEQKCAYVVPTRIGDYNFSYDPKSGWRIESLYHPYWDLYDALVR